MTERTFEFASEDELYNICEDTDCLYCRMPVPMTKPHLSQRHLRFALFYKAANSVKLTIPCYCPDGAHGRSHWHCSKCEKTIKRAGDFKTHLENHGYEITGKSSGAQQPLHEEKDSLEEQTQTQIRQQTPVKTDLSPEKGHLQCQKCRIEFSTTSNLRRHERIQHGIEQPMLCIDPKNAIFVTPKELHGPRLPVHVVKSLLLGKIYCESENCRDMARKAAQCGHPGIECHHLKGTWSAQRYIPPPPLNSVSLDNMFSKGLISMSKLQECKDIHLKASEERVDCVFPIFWGEFGLSPKCIYFSVFTNLKDNWCQLGRTIVTFDTISGRWHCRCKDTKDRLSCVHRYLCMWWIFQERPELLQKDVNVSPEETEITKTETAMQLTDLSC